MRIFAGRVEAELQPLLPGSRNACCTAGPGRRYRCRPTHSASVPRAGHPRNRRVTVEPMAMMDPFDITASGALLAAGAMMAGAMALAACGQPDDSADHAAPIRAAPIETGRPFPSVVLPDAADGRPRSIAEFRGRKVLLHVFASW